MAAQQAGRFCACLCGGSIDHLNQQTRYLPECAEEVRAARRKSQAYKDRDKYSRSIKPRKPKPYIPKVTEAPHPVGARLPHDPPHRVTIRCAECCDMPWRRPKNWRCRECLEPYAQEARPEQSVLRSSAGTASDAGRLWGMNVAGRGESYVKGSKRNGR